MNFFKSILSDDPDPVEMNPSQKSDDDILNPTSSAEAHGGGLWSFGDLVKNLTKPESDDDYDVSEMKKNDRSEEQQTNSDPTYSGEDDVDDSGGGLWSFGDLVKNLTKSESVPETDEGDEEQLTNLNSDYSGNNDVIDNVKDSGGGLWRFGDLVKTITTQSESVFESYSPNHQIEEGDEEQLTNLNPNSDDRDDVSNDGGGGGLWSFGDLVKNITNKSESVLETYRRDLKEFGSGLKKESDLFREVANRAVKELPETMKKSISQGKTVDVVDDSDANRVYYSRFDSQLNTIQNDVETYCKDPEDNVDEYNKWKLGFVLSENESKIKKLIGENGTVEGIYKKIVPNEVDEGSFWCRYFYKVYKLKQQEDVRASFVRRSLNVDDEEELSWDVDDDEQEEEEEEEEADLREIETKRNSNDEVEIVNSNVADDDAEKTNDLKLSGGDVSNKVDSVLKTDENHDHNVNTGKDLRDEKAESVLKPDENHDISKNDKAESVLKTDENLGHSEHANKGVCDEKLELKTDEKLDNTKAVKSSLQEEEDLEWDEIGDIGENDEKTALQSETPKKGDVFKRINNDSEDDADLSWDIEDDDEPVKAGSSK